MSNNFLEVGDYFPFIKVGSKDIHNYIESKFILFICVKDVSNIDIDIINTLNQKYYANVIYKENILSKPINQYFIQSNKIYDLFEIPEIDIKIYILDNNRKILDFKIVDSLEDTLSIETDQYKIDVHVPYLLINNVLSPELLKEIIDYFETNRKDAILHNSGTKNRLHIRPDKELEMKLDNKLSRSLFPEIKKIFGLDVTYREPYKICSYDGETSGRFHRHRDTPYPQQHRKYALSLFLNDDYEGGEFELVEYNLKVKPKANSAFIFPGICSHMVHPVTKGSRMTIITFLCDYIEGKTKNIQHYKVKSNFFAERKVQYSQIYPF